MLLREGTELFAFDNVKVIFIPILGQCHTANKNIFFLSKTNAEHGVFQRFPSYIMFEQNMFCCIRAVRFIFFAGTCL